MKRLTVFLPAALGALLIAASAANATATVSLVTVGSPTGNTPQNHQNEPAVAMDANKPNILVAGTNDFVDNQPCPQSLAVNAGTCLDRATGVGVSGDYFSFDSGHTWTQPAYTGWETATCNPVPCKGQQGTIHTLPWYFENQLVSFGDPAVAVGPVPGSNGKFSWANGDRVYYGNLTAGFSTQVELSFPNPVFNGFVGIAVSRIDNPTQTSIANKNSWKQPVILSSRQGQTSFFDKEQIWADNAQSSPFFGRVYLCANDFRSNAAHQQGNSPTPMDVFTSKDGGSTWTKVQVTSASTGTTNNPNQFGYSGCTIRTGSDGVVYLFAERFAAPTSTGLTLGGQHVMFKSFDGGAHWTSGQVVQTVTNPCHHIDPVEGRCVMDGWSGARTDLGASPSVSIANGAPTGANATNEIIDAWSDAPSENHEITDVSFGTNGGSTWSSPQPVSLSGDRPIYSAPAISPDGSKAYVIYEADRAPFATDFTSSRPYHGVFLSSPLNSSGQPTGWTQEFNEPATGDLRATYPGHNIYQERIGDYIYAAASDDYGVGLWISAVNAAVCPAIQSWRASSFEAGAEQFPAPWPLAPPPGGCPSKWGNTDAYSVSTG